SARRQMGEQSRPDGTESREGPGPSNLRRTPSRLRPLASGSHDPKQERLRCDADLRGAYDREGVAGGHRPRGRRPRRWSSMITARDATVERATPLAKDRVQEHPMNRGYDGNQKDLLSVSSRAWRRHRDHGPSRLSVRAKADP